MNRSCPRMEIPYFSFVILYFSLLCNLFSSGVTSFSPIDNYLIDCGSTADTDVYNRRFSADGSCSSRSNSPIILETRSNPLTVQNIPTDSLAIYSTARVFTRPAKYVFSIRDPGTHMVRLHFHGFIFNSHDLVSRDASFHVVVNDYTVLSNFSNWNDMKPRIFEYLIWAGSDKLAITFIPTRKLKYAYVNAIEVISAPKDLVADTAQFVDGDGDGDGGMKIDGITKQAFETVYRVNVGGPKLTPFNDTLWRTWVTDDEFLKSSDMSNRVYYSGRIKYQIGGASREVGPAFVYNTARVISSTNATIPVSNLTWEFPVMEGYDYLVRLHFCDIASISLGLIYFNVYVNGHLAYHNLDLSYVTNGVLASPFYADFVVNGNELDTISVKIGPSNTSVGYAIDGILNGVEIMKMNNSMGSFDGKLLAKDILNNCSRVGNIGVLVPLVAVLCILLIISVIVQRRRVVARDYIAWSKLPVDVPQFNSKHGISANA